jgi:hypothetical protein
MTAYTEHLVKVFERDRTNTIRTESWTECGARCTCGWSLPYRPAVAGCAEAGRAAREHGTVINPDHPRWSTF